MLQSDIFLPGVAVEYVLARLEAAGGNEVASGKLAHPESSAALAVNTFGWFIECPALLPPLPGTEDTGIARRVDVEYSARFPWSGGRHPWLDAAVSTDTHLIGVESKRYEPFRDAKTASLASAYDRPVWGKHMGRFSDMRDALRSGEAAFAHLDAAQLVKHAYGLVTDARRLGKVPVLFYLFAEPVSRGDQPIAESAIERHRAEIADFAAAVWGDEVSFYAASYREWLATWEGGPPSMVDHGAALIRRFEP